MPLVVQITEFIRLSDVDQTFGSFNIRVDLQISERILRIFAYFWQIDKDIWSDEPLKTAFSFISTHNPVAFCERALFYTIKGRSAETYFSIQRRCPKDFPLERRKCSSKEVAF